MTHENDRELLERAAKAAGLKAQYSENMGDFAIGELCSGNEVRWNPLTDDGDALRLASDLNIHVEGVGAINGGGTIVLGYVEANGLREDYRGNVASRHAATRRAIVRAAAQIGKQS